MSEDSELRVNGLTVTYGRGAVGLAGVSLRAAPSSITAVLGANGAGKTTLLSAIAGFLRADDVGMTGAIEFQGKSLERLRPDVVARRGVVLVPERDKVFATLTVEENLRAVPVARRHRDKNDDLRAWIMELFPVLAQRQKQVAGLLSGGEKQMLGIARALMLRPKLLLADELSLGIAPALVPVLLGALKRIRDDFGTTVLLVEQNVHAALEIADAAFVIENGRISFSKQSVNGDGDMSQVVEAFFGGQAPEVAPL